MPIYSNSHFFSFPDFRFANKRRIFKTWNYDPLYFMCLLSVFITRTYRKNAYQITCLIEFYALTKATTLHKLHETNYSIGVFCELVMFLILRVCPKPRIIETLALCPLFPFLKPVKLAFRCAGMVWHAMVWYGVVWYGVVCV
jgi:hypothetical protein